MDRALDDIINDKKRSSFRSRDRRPPRDGVRKPTGRREESRNIDSDWVHDRYDDDDSRGPRRNGGRGGLFSQNRRRSPEERTTASGAKIKIENLHYDLTEEDVRELFTRIGEVSSVELLYDRQDRSRGIAYVTMPDIRDARDAVRDFDGANANGQPIRVTLLASSSTGRARNPFDTAERPSRSLFDRVEKRSRSESPQSRPRRGERLDHIDRYVPGERSDSRRRSPLPRRGGGNDSRRGSRRPGERPRRGPQTDAEGHKLVQGRPRKTQEELDAEMEDYWGNREEGAAASAGDTATATAAATGDVGLGDDDVDMIE
ncbi:uncharacterized protein PV09_04338 [Verruconis gallopava]|uniref:RRM domain-containing protein n=1 Tax=Verruconis gallopava TaxID=253628 RepID=A0A0D2ADP8_9PEZI|nr:uncharacterized protein PV09_04338 [Verruconis gallopava]KIW04590.1 hypothetical protein PV09_04338 [Verruconis gallopava]